MSNPIQDKRAVIYSYNVKKAAELVTALNMGSETEMINYLIESADIQQITKITFQNDKTKKSFSITRTTPKYDPKNF